MKTTIFMKQSRVTYVSVHTAASYIADIYQAVCEERPYHAARSHEETMPILYGMAEKGFIDTKIVKDLDVAMAGYSLRDLSPPLI
jgi:hypothetical protein